jgi:hypothetical protein
MSNYPGALSFYGIGKETTPGTAVVGTRFPPFTTFDPVDKPMPLIDQGMRGSMGTEYGGVMGPEYCEASLAGPFFADFAGDLLYNMLGGYGVTGAGPYAHTFGLLNTPASSGQPPTHTFIDRQGMTPTVGARVYPFGCLSELVISGNAEDLCQLTGKLSAFPSAAAAAAPTNTPTSETVIPAWRSTVTLGGVAVPNIAEWSVTLSRVLKVQNATDGTQAPLTIFRGELTVAYKLSVVAVDESPLTDLIGNVQNALVITIDNGGVGAAQRTLQLTMSKRMHTDAPQKRDTLMGWDVSGKGLMNATDATAGGGNGLAPIKAVLTNGITTY